MSVRWAGKPVIGLMVNGAQGDDDEAHGGHFAIVTGRVQADGSIDDWLVNNFYSLDVESEKGIIAAPVPLDNYLADLNSGQGWYRPTTMLVAVLDDERAAVLVQSALNRVFNQFYRHQLVYYHPNQNCASISVDTLRALGWDVPARGPSSRVLAWLAYPFIADQGHVDRQGQARLRLPAHRPDAADAGRSAGGSVRQPALRWPGAGSQRPEGKLGHDAARRTCRRSPSFASRSFRRAAPSVTRRRSRPGSTARSCRATRRWRRSCRCRRDRSRADLRDPDLLPARGRRPTTRRWCGPC